MARKPPIGWHPEQIKAELRRRHGPITSLAISWGFAGPAISHVLRRPDYSSVIERKIAEALDCSPHELWPARWSAEGVSLPRTSQFDPIPSPRVRNSQNRKAA
jgi:Ner family transcriptional regulator